MSYQCRKTLLYKQHLWLLGISSVHFQTGSLYSRDCSDHYGKIKMKEILSSYLKKTYKHKTREKGQLGKKKAATQRLTDSKPLPVLPSHHHLSTHLLTLHLSKANRKYINEKQHKDSYIYSRHLDPLLVTCCAALDKIFHSFSPHISPPSICPEGLLLLRYSAPNARRPLVQKHPLKWREFLAQQQEVHELSTVTQCKADL